MNAALETPSNPLKLAQQQMRAVFKYFQERDPRGSDTGTLERMIAHLNNIERSVTASMQDHVNASKRLKDFGDTIERMSAHMGEESQSQVVLMRELATTLRAAGMELGKTGAPPAWASANPNP
jgi:phage gpG-like protein